MHWPRREHSAARPAGLCAAGQDKSGFWIFIELGPFIGVIWLLVLMARHGVGAQILRDGADG